MDDLIVQLEQFYQGSFKTKSETMSPQEERELRAMLVLLPQKYEYLIRQIEIYKKSKEIVELLK